MKRAFIQLCLIVVVVVLTSCQQVYFTQPQPLKGKVVSQFNSSQQGVYKCGDEVIRLTQDSIITDGLAFSLTLIDPLKHQALVKVQKDIFYVNVKDSLYYLVVLGRFYEDKLAVYMLNADERTANALRRFTTVDEIMNGDKKSYVIQPTKHELNTIVDYDLFDVVNVYQKVK